MKYQTLRIVASCISVLVWVVVAAGIVASVMVGIGAATAVAKIAFLLGGLVLTAIDALMLFVASRLIYLFIDIEEDLRELADIMKQNGAHKQNPRAVRKPGQYTRPESL